MMAMMEEAVGETTMIMMDLGLSFHSMLSCKGPYPVLPDSVITVLLCVPFLLNTTAFLTLIFDIG